MGYLCSKWSLREVGRCFSAVDELVDELVEGQPSTASPVRTHHTETATVATNQATRPGRVLTQRLSLTPI
ncbi:hypothetical protein GCM10009844_04950 [Nocardioides koreensis]|uniref:Uncharacterized protein n=1 Tax=Nocardioides koreensis TaxID=433651 RepID=A0ABP5KUN6_9ACTN